MSKKPDHRLKLIRTAAQLFQTQGYSASGINQIIAQSKTPRGSFYYYFPAGKEQLAQETVLHTGEEIRQLLEQALADAPSFAAGIDSITSLIADWFAQSGYTAGCPITAVHLEKTPENPMLSEACQQVFSSWVTTIQQVANQFGHEKRAVEIAEAAILALEGAWILARATQSKRPFVLAGNMVKSMLD